MPAVAQGKVLVTGANGYAAAWVVETLLKKGYAVRAGVRTAEKGKYLETIFQKYGDALELAVVGDITEVGIFMFLD